MSSAGRDAEDDAQFLLRYRYIDGTLQAAFPLWSVEDSRDRRVGWLAAGSEISYWALPDGSDPRRLPIAERFSAPLTTAVREWQGTGVLRVFLRDHNYQVLHFWDDHRFRGWYFNFETPGDWRGPIIESRDWHLDLIVLPDFTATWKDEEEAVGAVDGGHLLPAELAEARRTGEALLRRPEEWLEAVGDWREFVPHERWNRLRLPDDWTDGTAAVT